MFVSAPVLVLWFLAHVLVEQQKRSIDEACEVFASTFPDDAAMLVVDTVGEAVEVAS
jgi:hypothetical protein